MIEINERARVADFTKEELEQYVDKLIGIGFKPQYAGLFQRTNRGVIKTVEGYEFLFMETFNLSTINRRDSYYAIYLLDTTGTVSTTYRIKMAKYFDRHWATKLRGSFMLSDRGIKVLSSIDSDHSRLDYYMKFSQQDAPSMFHKFKTFVRSGSRGYKKL